MGKVIKTNGQTRIDGKPNGNGARRTYTDADKERAIATYVTTGNLSRTSRETGVPISTLRGWIAEIPPVKVQAAREDARAKFVRKAWETVEAYLDHLRKPDVMKTANAKDGATVVGILVDKAHVTDGKPTAIERFEGQVQHEHEHNHSLTLKQLLEQRGRGQDGSGDPSGDPGEFAVGDPLPALLRRGSSLTR